MLFQENIVLKLTSLLKKFEASVYFPIPRGKYPFNEGEFLPL